MLKNKLSLSIDLSNRKYRMITTEVIIVIMIVALSQAIAYYFPIEEPLREFGNDYWLYMLLALVEVVLIGAMFFVSGYWYSEWRVDKKCLDS